MKGISKEQIDALTKITHYSEIDNTVMVKLSDLRALYDNAPSVGEPVGELHELSHGWECYIWQEAVDNKRVKDGDFVYTTPQPDRVSELTLQRDRLLQEFKKVRQTLEDENNDLSSAIIDTIWMQEGNETLFDYMDSVIAELDQAMKG